MGRTGLLGGTLPAAAAFRVTLVAPRREWFMLKHESRPTDWQTAKAFPSRKFRRWLERGRSLRPISRILSVALLLLASPAFSQPARHAPHRALVRFRPETTLGARRLALQDLGIALRREYRLPGLALVEDSTRDAAQLIERMSSLPQVLYAEPDYEVEAVALPDDPNFPEQYGLHSLEGPIPGHGVGADRAWDWAVGDTSILIGVIDTGLDYDHPDLAPNVWTNPGEIAGNEVDDDGNGFVDDVHGFDFLNRDGDPMDDNRHGTHVAGIIAARGNNGIGTAGVCWRARIVGLKFLGSTGSGYVSDAIDALEYAIQMGIRITNNSWGGGGYSRSLRDEIITADMAGCLFVAAAGNSGSDLDQVDFYPASFHLPNEIVVAATDENGDLAGYSNYGATRVDVAAPGTHILSTFPGGGYAMLSGTSMAAPHVTGSAALLWNFLPQLTHSQVRALLLSSTDPGGPVAGRVAAGFLNLYRALAERDTVPPDPVRDLAASDVRSTTLLLTWTAPGDPLPGSGAGSYEVRVDSLPLDESRWARARPLPGAPRPAQAGEEQSFEVTGLDWNRELYLALRSFDAVGNPSPLSNVVQVRTQGVPRWEATLDTVRFDLDVGDTASARIRVDNTGDGDLLLELGPPSLVLGTLPEGGAGALAVGGPDEFGYRYSDSSEPGSRPFEWVDIASTGTQLSLSGDDVSSPSLPVGFDLPFYGRFVNSFRVCSNGFLSFSSSATLSVNLPFPGAGPPNCIAPFWDDLDLSAHGSIFYQADTNRCVISWLDVPRKSTGGSYTFQAILYPTGDITFQYLHLSYPRNSASAGIQNLNRDQGLSVVTNRDYLQDGMAVFLRVVPQWLDAEPKRVHIPPGASDELRLRVDASGLRSDAFTGRVRLTTNDPQAGAADVWVQLRAHGFPRLGLATPTLDLGSFYAGERVERGLSVLNVGSEDLIVSGITVSGAELATAPAGMRIPPGGTRRVTVTFLGQTVGPYSGELQLLSNDPSTPATRVEVVANVLPAPRLYMVPESLQVVLDAGEQHTELFALENQGSSTLSWRLEVVAPRESVEVKLDHPALARSLGPLSTVPSVGTPGVPDRFGYRFRDSTDPRGPVYRWVDVSGVGTPIALPDEDACSEPLPIGFPFPFYDDAFTSLRVSSNGWISFTSSSTSYLNGRIPGAGAPSNLIAPFWDDLTLTPTSRVYYFSDGAHLVVQWQDVEHFDDPGHPYTFEAVLGADGSIVFQYRLLGRLLNSCTVGIQNARQDDGLEVARDFDYLREGLAVRFTSVPEWAAPVVSRGSILPGGGFPLEVGFDTSRLSGGAHRALLRFFTNDPRRRQFDVPLTVVVRGVPRIALDASSLEVGNAFTDDSSRAVLLVRNPGTTELEVESARSATGRFRARPSSFHVGPGLGQPVEVWFRPGAEGSFRDTLRFSSNDPERPEVSVALAGIGVVPPPLRAAPETLSTAVTVNGSRTRTLTLHNSTAQEQHLRLRAISMPLGSPLGGGVVAADGFGYRWLDPTHPEGPRPGWLAVERTQELLPLAGTLEISEPLELGFSFPFYGDSFSVARVAVDGYVSFSGIDGERVESLPSSRAPGALIAALWRDWSAPTPRVYWTKGRDSVVVSWVGMVPAGGGAPASFQLVLYTDGRWETRYGEDWAGTKALVGAQDARAEDGVTVTWTEQSAPWAFEARPDRHWLDAPHADLVVPAQGTLEVPIELRAPVMPVGDYAGVLSAVPLAPGGAAADAHAILHLDGLPDLLAAPNKVDFGTVFLGGEATRWLELANQGQDTLLVRTFYTTARQFVVENSDLAIPPGGRTRVAIRFRPDSYLYRQAMLWMDSNDEDPPVYGVALVGRGVPAPLFSAGPDTLLPVSLRGDSAAALRELVVRNLGESPLVWSLIPLEVERDAPLFWLEATPDSGTLAVRAESHVDIRYRTDGLPAGRYRGRLRAVSNDPLRPWRDWRLELIVPPAGRLVPPAHALSYPATYREESADLPLVIDNIGEGPVYLLGARTRGVSFQLVEREWPRKVKAGGRDTLWVRFAPKDTCRCVDTLRLATDQPESILVVPLLGSSPGERPPCELRFALVGPNPSRGALLFALDLPQALRVELALFDVRGARIRVLANGAMEPGRHRVEWDGRAVGGTEAPSGIYFARLRAGRDERVLKLVRVE